MILTDRAKKYLQKQKRDWAWTTYKFTTNLYLKSHGLPAFEPILNFQSDYSGYHLTSETKVADSFSLKLFSKKDNYVYWALLLEEDPIIEPLKDFPEFKEVMKTMKTKFWNRHEELKKMMREKKLMLK